MGTTIVLGGLFLALASQSGQPHSVSASNQGLTGYLVKGPAPFSDAYAQGSGSVSLSLTDRVRSARELSGDTARVYARFSGEGSTYEVYLDQVGYQRADLSRGAQLRHPIEGGVMFDRWLHGNTGLGSGASTRVHAMAAVWGVGRVIKDGRTLTDKAFIHAAALDQGSHADDSSHRLLPQARAGDGEIYLVAENLPVTEEPAGFVQFEFDDVSIAYDSQQLALESDLPAVPSTGSPTANEGAGRVFAGGAFGTDLASGTGGSGLEVQPPSGVLSQVQTRPFLPASAVTLFPGSGSNAAASGTPVSVSASGEVTVAPSSQPATGIFAGQQANGGTAATLAPSGVFAGQQGTGGAGQPASSGGPEAPLPDSLSPGVPATTLPGPVSSESPATNPALDTSTGAASTLAPPASNSVANNGSQVSPFPSTPAPLSSTAASPLPSGQPAASATTAVPLLQTPAPANAQPATSGALPSSAAGQPATSGAIPLPATPAPGNAAPAASGLSATPLAR